MKWVIKRPLANEYLRCGEDMWNESAVWYTTYESALRRLYDYIAALKRRGHDGFSDQARIIPVDAAGCEVSDSEPGPWEAGAMSLSNTEGKGMHAHLAKMMEFLTEEQSPC